MFGPGGTPDKSFRKGLKTLLALNEKDWDVIASWFLATKSFDLEEALSSTAFAGSPLTPEQATESIEALKFILEAWHLHSLELEEIQRDLMLLGYAPEEIERLGALLDRLSPVKERAWASYMRSEHENAVLPTLEDIDVVCDLRPIFEDYVYPLPVKETIQHKRLIGFTYMVLAELQTEDIMGRKQKLAFQMTEQRLKDLESALGRARDQLDILKARTHALAVESQ